MQAGTGTLAAALQRRVRQCGGGSSAEEWAAGSGLAGLCRRHDAALVYDLAGVVVAERHGRTCAGLSALLALSDGSGGGADADDRDRLRGECAFLLGLEGGCCAQGVALLLPRCVQARTNT